MFDWTNVTLLAISTAIAAGAWFLNDMRTLLKDLETRFNKLDRDAQRIDQCRCYQLETKIAEMRFSTHVDFITKDDFKNFEGRIDNNFVTLNLKFDKVIHQIFEKLNHKADK